MAAPRSPSATLSWGGSQEDTQQSPGKDSRGSRTSRKANTSRSRSRSRSRSLHPSEDSPSSDEGFYTMSTKTTKSDEEAPAGGIVFRMSHCPGCGHRLKAEMRESDEVVCGECGALTSIKKTESLRLDTRATPRRQGSCSKDPDSEAPKEKTTNTTAPKKRTRAQELREQRLRDTCTSAKNNQSKTAAKKATAPKKKPARR
jgi:hypothetical protein